MPGGREGKGLVASGTDVDFTPICFGWEKQSLSHKEHIRLALPWAFISHSQALGWEVVKPELP